MPDLGLIFLLTCAAFGAGAIRGFAGFGDALFFLPIAGLVIDPISCIAAFTLMAAIGPLPLLPQAKKEAPRKLLSPLLIGMVIFTPIGFYFLSQSEPENFRYALSFMAITMVTLMAFGVHPNFHITPRSAAILGIICGLIGGFTGVPGAILLFVLLNSQLRAKEVRAIGIISLLIFDVIMLIGSGFLGALNAQVLTIALAALPAYMLGSWLGRKVFNPEHERAFRLAAMALILASGIIGLPIWAGQ